MIVTYRRFDEAYADFRRTLHRLCSKPAVRTVLDVGGGANPQFDRKTVERYDLQYVLNDISPAELQRAPAGYRTLCLDVTEPGAVDEGPFDLVFSCWVAEHIRDPAAFHGNLGRMLVPGGRAVHLFPTLYALPFLLNRMLPEAGTAAVVRALTPARRFDEDEGKFPARYRWCRGPTHRQVRRFERAGYRVAEYRGYFGHEYLARVPWAQAVEDGLTRMLLRRPLPALTTWAMVVLERPACVESSGLPRAGQQPDTAA